MRKPSFSFISFIWFWRLFQKSSELITTVFLSISTCWFAIVCYKFLIFFKMCWFLW